LKKKGWPLAVAHVLSVKFASQMTSLVASLVAVAVCLLTVSVWLLRRRKRVQLARQQSQRHASPVSRIPPQRSGNTIEIERSRTRIAPSQSSTVEQPAIEDEAAKNPDERHSVPAVAAPQSEILEAELSGNPADGGSALDEVQDSREVIPANEEDDGRQVPIEVALEDAEPPAAVKAQAIEPDNASHQETVPLAQVSADVIVLEPESTAPAGAGRGDERPRDEATVKTADDSPL
jgi:hypothetical protein